MDNKDQRTSAKLANRYYSSDDYRKKDDLSKGLATTHEQVSDVYTEGEINGVIDDVNGEDIPLRREGKDK